MSEMQIGSPSPFNKPTADVILRTSNPMDFRVHKVILSAASTFFETMFSLPQAPQEDMSVLPVIPVTEDSKVLDALLRIVYPVVNPTFSDVEELGCVLGAAMKYDIAVAKDICLQNLLHSSWDPIGVYAITTRLKLRDQTQEAAEQAATMAEFLNGPQSYTMSTMSSMALLHLIRYREQHTAALVAALENFDFDNFEFESCCERCISSWGPPQNEVQIEYDDFLVDAVRLVSAWPCEAAILSSVMLRSAHSYIPESLRFECESCVVVCTGTMYKLQAQLTRWMMSTAAKVQLEMDF